MESVIERVIIPSQRSALQIPDRFEPLINPDDQNVKALADFERNHFLQVLQNTGWRVERRNGTAILLGLVSNTTLR